MGAAFFEWRRLNIKGADNIENNTIKGAINFQNNLIIGEDYVTIQVSDDRRFTYGTKCTEKTDRMESQ